LLAFIVTADGASKRFGFVNGYDEKPKRRLFEVSKSQGMQMNQQVTFVRWWRHGARATALLESPSGTSAGLVSYHFGELL